MSTFNFYEPSFIPLPKEQIDFSYYELRVWRNHIMEINEGFKTLKKARQFYKKQKLDIEEENGSCYVEIIHVKPLKK